MSATENNSCRKICCFCGISEEDDLEYGKIYEHNGIVTHYYCLLLSSNMEQKGDDDEGILGFLTEDIQKELRRGKRLVCSYCKKNGATLGCCNSKCKRIFHLPCGLKAGSLHQFFGEFRSYCINHRPKQKIDDYILKEISSLDDIMCYICYDKVNPNDSGETLWAPCCKKDAWFHRKCVQQLALSAGYFFKCPLCNNKKDFQKAMLEHGIFIPSQDASWELVPNAFEELLYRHDQCDATICLCPKGRKHTSNNAKWELALCRICGSQGIHMACGQLKWGNPVWECTECTSILSNSKNREDRGPDNNSDSSSQSRDFDSDDSDSDISVGTDYPIPNTISIYSSSSTSSIDSNIRLRPGPRSFKLQQQIKADKTKCTSDSENNVAPDNNNLQTLLLETNKTNPKDTSDKLSKNMKESSTNMENNAQQDNNEKCGLQQTNEKDNSEKRRKPDNEKPKSTPVIITIESDDDDIEIIALKRKEIPTVRNGCSNVICSPEHNVISASVTENSAAFVPKPREITRSDLLRIRTDRRVFGISKSKILNESESITSERFGTITPQQSAQDAIPLNSDSEVVNASPIMNIKITNVTSLPPEVFASVPDVRQKEENIREDVTLQEDSSNMPCASKSLEKWLVTHFSHSKRGMHEEVDNNKDNNCKRIKGSNLDEISKDSSDIVSYNSIDHLEQNRNIIPKEQNQSTDEAKPNSTHNEVKNSSKCTTLVNKVSSPSLSNNQRSDSVIRSIRKNDVTYTNVGSNNLEGSSTPEIIVQQSSEVPVKLYTSVIQNTNNQLLQIPPNVFYAKSASKTQYLQDTEKNVTYVTSNNPGLPQVISSSTTINNPKTTIINKPTVTSVVEPINTINNQQKVLNKQEVDLLQEKLPDLMFSSGNRSSSNIICDGDAGGTSPAVTPRSACFYETAETTRISDKYEISKTDTAARGRSLSNKSHARVKKISTSIKNPNDGNRDIFPQVTNNLTTCHQPRLTPQYMYLHDLKFRVCGPTDVQMILYDTFSVNIPMGNNSKEGKNKSGVTMRELKESTLISQVQGEASSNLDCVASTSTSHLDNNTTKHTIDATAVNIVHDDAKENLDPVFRTQRATRNNILDNIILNGIDNTMTTEYICENTDRQMCLVSSDTNLSILNQTVSNMNINNGEDSMNLRIDRKQNSRISSPEDIQHKQFTCNLPTSTEEETSSRLFCNRSSRSIDFNLDVTDANKNVQKTLQDDITVSMTNQYVNSNRIINHNYINNSPMLCLNRSLCTTTNNRGKNNSFQHFDSMTVHNQSVAHISNIIFNECNISNRQINACNSKQFLHCMELRKNTSKYKTDDNYENNSHLKFASQFAIKVSIDLCKIQDLLNSKPELFLNMKHVNSTCQRYKCISQARSEDKCTKQQVKYCDIEDHHSRHNPLRNNELQVLNDKVETIQVRDTFSNVNYYLDQHLKQKRETKLFDKCILDR